MAKGAIVLLVVAALGGCATTQLPPGDAAGVPANRVSYVSPKGADSTLVVVRDAGFLGKGCAFALYINKALAATLESGEMARFAVPSGEILLGVGRDPAGKLLCSPGADPAIVTRETVIKPGETKHFRLALHPTGAADIIRSDF